jgi:DNA-binding MarR family transcriptional regulator
LTPDDIGTRVVALARTPGTAKLLQALSARSLHGTEAAELLGKTKARAGQILSQLERVELVSRRSDPDDGRATLWSLTDDGRAALQMIEGARPMSKGTGWVFAVKLGGTGKRELTRSLLDELAPSRVYRVVGDLDFMAVSHSADASVDLIADLRRRLHEVARVEATHIGYMVGKGGHPDFNASS